MSRAAYIPTIDTATASSASSFTYGVSFNDENEPLLSPQSTSTSYYTCDPEDNSNRNGLGRASRFSGTVNLLNTILGTGMLAMPAAVATVGIFPGVFLTIFAGIASGTGLYLLTCCADMVGGRNTSFFGASQLTWPSAAVWFDLAIAIKCFGVATSYIIIVGDLLPQVAKSLFGLDMSRGFWITVVVVGILTPLGFLRTLDALRHVSTLAIVAVVYLTAIVVYHFLSPTFQHAPADEIEWFHVTSGIFGQLPVFIFAFTCHQNIFSVYNELKKNDRRSMVAVITSSIGFSVIVYETIAILGYLTFGKNAKGNIVLEYPSSLFVEGGRLAIVLLVIFSYPLQLHPCRNCLDKVLAIGLWTAAKISSEQQQTNNARRGKTPKEASLKKHALMSAGILLGTYIVSMTISQLDLVLAFVGSTGSTTISFILPGAFYYKLHADQPWSKRPSKFIALGLALFGCLVMVVCLSFNIQRLVNN
ncbi:hypothetical protein VTP01DRAFT_4722 [Rhizomucor pusillus]|uniref:uncharacterized protein n=1 Tax=Rhizomucor pusillus TaxID=4840 RepID=UPI003742A685